MEAILRVRPIIRYAVNVRKNCERSCREEFILDSPLCAHKYWRGNVISMLSLRPESEIKMFKIYVSIRRSVVSCLKRVAVRKISEIKLNRLMEIRMDKNKVEAEV